MATKRKTTPKKRGSKDERLFVSEDPQATLHRLLKSRHGDKAAFHEAQASGTDALKRSDGQALSAAIDRERKILDKQAKAFDAVAKALRRRK